ncbi:GNAT family N-acetyltransferase [Roseibium sp.]|uniref:GNAT family N-acetyltransferase n=1 Tax=Roseibium sp. TaxID=1936156 RepID=UPI003A9742BA
MHVRTATRADLPALLDIQNHVTRHLAASWTTIEETLDSKREWFDAQQAAGWPVFVAEDESGIVQGYASYGPYRPKNGYRFTVSNSVYVREQASGKGLGRALMNAVIEHARSEGYHAMVAGIDGDNASSIAFHEALGFIVSGRLPQVGTKFGRWLDLVQMVLLLNDEPAPAA